MLHRRVKNHLFHTHLELALVDNSPMKKTEILLPVADMTMCLAAIHNGADAIYMGVRQFNARGRSEQLTLKDAKDIIDLCHLYGVKVNLAFNVLIFEDELQTALEVLLDYLALGPDAFIIQDLGLAKLLRTLAPTQAIHASTQMTITNHESIDLLEDLDIKRFVLGRENSLSEIRKIRAKTKRELEVFVHGALCVAYSGQCLTSESLGGRSANRGQCAQSCRLPYELFVDGEKKEMGDKRYLVSPQDLCGIEEANTLAEMGVECLKIEGRLKTPEYVAATAKNYSQKLNGLEVNHSELALTYSRGFFPGWLNGVDHQQLVPADFQSHRGLEVGTLKEIKNQSLVIQSERQLNAGEGLFFLKGEKHIGARIFKVLNAKDHLQEVSLHNQKLNELELDMKVYLNSDPKIDEKLKKSYTQVDLYKKIPLIMSVEASLGSPLKIKVCDNDGHSIEVISENLCEAPLKNSTTLENLEDELSSLGRTCFILKELSVQAEAPFFFSQKNLKKMRQELVRMMSEQRIQRATPELFLDSVQEILKPSLITKTSKSSQLSLLIRNKDQLQAFDSTSSDTLESVILDYEFGKDYQESINFLRDLNIKVGIATTRIHKPDEYYNLNLLKRLAPDFIMVRNLGALSYLKDSGIELRGDFSLNATNHLTCQYLLSHGLTSITASFDLNDKQVFDLIESISPDQLEVVIHQYMPEFHMEHCVFAAFLSTGSSFKDCGKPCEKHSVELKDPYGQFHYLKADHECRNTFFRGKPQSAGFLLNELSKRGVGKMRIEALSENADVLKEKIQLYYDLLNNKITYDVLRKKMNVQEKYGILSL